MLLQIISLIVSVISLILVGVLIFKLKNKSLEGQDFSSALLLQEKMYKNMTELLLSSIKNYNDSVITNIAEISKLNRENLNEVILRQDDLLKNNALQLEKATKVLADGLEKLQKDNEQKLEQMRQTVDEKLNVSLQYRLNQSFELINKRLQDVYEGLGEMKSLASGVGDLKRVLTNVKTRGIWGEVQLGNLLEQMLSPHQFVKNFEIKKNTNERVDYAVILPGKDDKSILLPIDAKFPIEDYQKLLDAQENLSMLEIENYSKQIERRIKEEAKKIKEKYIDIPNTTDFAIMYLPIEGLYAEVLRRPGLAESLQREYKINICGPTTLAALLNSLQLGFKTLSIEKRSSEIWNLLGTFKQEFDKFVDLLAKTQKKLNEASNTIEFATKKSITIQRKLKNVSTETQQIPAGFYEEEIVEPEPEDEE